MKKMIVFLFVAFSVFAADWSSNFTSTKFSGEKRQYELEGTFTVLDTLVSRDREILGKDYDVSWSTYPFTAYWNVTAVDSIDATVATWYVYGVMDDTTFPVDTLSVNIGTKTDSSNYTTLNFNNRKFPEYRVHAIGDSCTSKLVIW